MGRSFLFRVAKPKGDVPGNLGFERKRGKGLRLVSLSQITAQKIVKLRITTEEAHACETRQQ
jgi:hypothetical protein